MRAPLRVLHVSAYFAPAFRYGGPPRSILGLCQALTRAGAAVEVFTTTANGDSPLTAVPGGTTYDGVHVRYFPLAWPPVAWRASGLAASVHAAARNADVMHVHGLWNATAWAGVRAARAAGIPYVISPRGMLQPDAMAHHHALKAIAYPAVERPHLRGASLLHATSDAEARVLASCGPRVALVPNGVDPRVASPDLVMRLRRRLDVQPDADVITMLGRLHPIKRLDLLADAFTRLRLSGRAATLVVAGPDESGHRREVEPLFRAVADDVRWTGTIDGDDKWALLQTSAALVQCSDSESFGMSVAEAMSAGVPVVVTERGAWAHVAAIGAGFIVDHSGEAIAAALDRLLADTGPARAMGERGRAWAARTLDWDAAGCTMLREYETIAGRVEAAAS